MIILQILDVALTSSSQCFPGFVTHFEHVCVSVTLDIPDNMDFSGYIICSCDDGTLSLVRTEV